jgi:hypothetical protein
MILSLPLNVVLAVKQQRESGMWLDPPCKQCIHHAQHDEEFPEACQAGFDWTNQGCWNFQEEVKNGTIK